MVGKREGALALRVGAYGDMLYALPAMEMLKRDHGYLHLDCGMQGAIVFQGNTTFDRITVFSPGKMAEEVRKAGNYAMIMSARHAAIEGIGWSKAVNFWRCLEVSCIAEIHQDEFQWPRERRREAFGSKNFHDEHVIRAGYEPGILKDYGCGTFEFTHEELEYIRNFQEKQGHRFNIVVAVAGSTAQKVPMGLEDIVNEFVRDHKEARVILVGDNQGVEMGRWYVDTIGKNKVRNECGSLSYRESLAMVRQADFVVGPETSMLVAAGMFGIPKTMICTSCSVWQANGYNKNDFSIQSYTACSPCHRAIYQKMRDGRSTSVMCNFLDSPFGQIPACNIEYKKERILEGMEYAYRLWSVRKSCDDFERKRVGSLPDLQSLPICESNRSEKV